MKPKPHDDELRSYDSFVEEIVVAARLKFIENQAKGKAGWNVPAAWPKPRDDVQECASVPLHYAIGEAREASTENDLLKRTLELGDALNFLVFDLAVQRAIQAAERRHPE